MKKLIVVAMIALSAFSSFGWGPTGHRATGRIAEKYMNKKARAAVNKLLKGQSIAMATTWMDDIRSDSVYDHMTDWHWVTVPFGQSYDQTTKNPNGDIIGTIERIITELKSKKLSADEQAERIKILVHLIGDIHQPLHVGGRADRGGNDVKVMWFRNESNLHRVWDSDMIDDTKLSYTELADALDRPGKVELAAWQKLSVRDWAKESQAFEKQVYDIGSGKLGYRYSYLYFNIVRQRLLQAGVRIAGVLNEIYGK